MTTGNQIEKTVNRLKFQGFTSATYGIATENTQRSAEINGDRSDRLIKNQFLNIFLISDKETCNNDFAIVSRVFSLPSR
jgi:hypothetical protein